MTARYDTIGTGYTATRAADPRILGRLIELLDLPIQTSLLDVGAGTGNYSFALAEAGFSVSALEPSSVMREQGKKHERLSWHAGSAEALPFPSSSFDGIVMTLCMHHFTDWKKGLLEAARVANEGPIVILTYDAYSDTGFWLFDYFPSFLEKDKKWFPRMEAFMEFSTETLSKEIKISTFPLPSDLIDHFAAAGWARPEIYLNSDYRSGISSFASVDKASIENGLRKLEEDIESGRWDERYGYLRSQPFLDTGYRFIKITNGEPIGSHNECKRSS